MNSWKIIGIEICGGNGGDNSIKNSIVFEINSETKIVLIYST